MRFMVIVKASPQSEAGELPDAQMLTEMGRYNEELAQAGVMLAGEGLAASSRGARVRFNDSERTVINGPFPGKDLVAGFWIFQTGSLEECIEWVKRCPNPHPGQEAEIEIRPIFEVADFGDALTPELREQEQRIGAKAAQNAAT
jgi:hypothetical protein